MFDHFIDVHVLFVFRHSYEAACSCLGPAWSHSGFFWCWHLWNDSCSTGEHQGLAVSGESGQLRSHAVSCPSASSPWTPHGPHRTHRFIFCHSVHSSRARTSDAKVVECRWLLHTSLFFCFFVYGPNNTIPHLPHLCVLSWSEHLILTSCSEPLLWNPLVRECDSPL